LPLKSAYIAIRSTIPIAILRAFNTALIFSWWRTVRDTCDGGSGTDTAAAYEIRLNIP
jgi:hypothetical protein